MENLYFTTKHMVKWRLKTHPYIVISEDKIMYNFKTGRVLNQTLNGSTIGYKIENKFYSLKKINENTETFKPKQLFNNEFL